jgi:hypothetical protein
MNSQLVSLDRKLCIVTDISVAFVSWSWQRVCVLYPCYVIVKVVKLFRRNTYVNPQYLEALIVLSVASCLSS